MVGTDAPPLTGEWYVGHEKGYAYDPNRRSAYGGNSYLLQIDWRVERMALSEKFVSGKPGD